MTVVGTVVLIRWNLGAGKFLDQRIVFSFFLFFFAVCSQIGFHSIYYDWVSSVVLEATEMTCRRWASTRSCVIIGTTHFSVRNIQCHCCHRTLVSSRDERHPRLPFFLLFFIVGAVWKRLGSLPHKNTLQAEWGLTRQAVRKEILKSDDVEQLSVRHSVRTTGCNQSSLILCEERSVKTVKCWCWSGEDWCFGNLNSVCFVVLVVSI